jgi:hypothetical protein
MKEITETKKCKGISALLNLIYRINTIPIKLSASYFVEMENLILKGHMGRQKVQNGQYKLKKSNQRTNTIQPDVT